MEKSSTHFNLMKVRFYEGENIIKAKPDAFINIINHFDCMYLDLTHGANRAIFEALRNTKYIRLEGEEYEVLYHKLSLDGPYLDLHVKKVTADS